MNISGGSIGNKNHNLQKDIHTAAAAAQALDTDALHGKIMASLTREVAVDVAARAMDQLAAEADARALDIDEVLRLKLEIEELGAVARAARDAALAQAKAHPGTIILPATAASRGRSAARSAGLRKTSWWSTSPSSTGKAQVPQAPRSQEESRLRPSARIASRTDVPAVTSTVSADRASSTVKDDERSMSPV